MGRFDEIVDKIGITTKRNGYRLADVKMMVRMACRSTDQKAAFDYILEEVTKKTPHHEIIMKLIRELPDSAVEYWDDSVVGKREEWGLKK